MKNSSKKPVKTSKITITLNSANAARLRKMGKVFSKKMIEGYINWTANQAVDSYCSMAEENPKREASLFLEAV